MRRLVLTAAAAGLLAAGGLAHGRLTGRWLDRPTVAQVAAVMGLVPREIGGWSGEDLELAERDREVGRIAGYVHRRYREATTGVEVTMLLVCGPPGPIAGHTPEVCFPGAGFSPAGAAGRLEVGPGPGTAGFRSGLYAKDDPLGRSEVEVLWTFRSGGRWVATPRPWLRHGSSESLEKLYLVAGAPVGGPSPTEAMRRFARLLLPELDRALGRAS